MGTREQGVGAEGDDGNEDISNFNMESDGLSMVSVSIEEECGHSSEEEADFHSSSSCQTPPFSLSSSTPLDHIVLLPPLPLPVVLSALVLSWRRGGGEPLSQP
ncbi:hypothetical protein FQA47_009547 [Oryzias melastigma]|uniref:Uncharacterized protein n=1 Tax=Oryzias melastigma TaxID=30732 RepID=A0A834CD76_ORYME|nr:hypothetical protein FQA47_009547 [Oryzias melastigma]